VNPRSGYRHLQRHSRRLHNKYIEEDLGPDPRGRKPKLTRDDLAKLKDIILRGGLQSRSLTWAALGSIAGIHKVYWRTIRNHIQDLDYYKCIACVKS
jgi:hypothetical protein